ncbi:MAG: outer membrane beta-barrel protein [Gemmatimonadaceae bacterium]
MKRFAIIASAAAFLCAAPAARAQVQFGLAAGGNFPVGNSDNDLKTGYIAQASIWFQPAIIPFGLVIDGAYSRWGYKGADGNARVIHGTLNGVFSGTPDMAFRPYITGGVGVYNFDESTSSTTAGVASTTESTGSVTKFGLNAGAGVSLPLSSVAVYAEARYHYVFLNSQHFSMVPVVVGIKFGAF